jgi:hypothetical protein
MEGGFTWPAAVGQQWLDLTGDGSNSVTGVQQTVATTPGSTYTLTFYVGNPNDPGGPSGTTSTLNVFVNGTQTFSITNLAGAGLDLDILAEVHHHDCGGFIRDHPGVHERRWANRQHQWPGRDHAGRTESRCKSITLGGWGTVENQLEGGQSWPPSAWFFIISMWGGIDPARGFSPARQFCGLVRVWRFCSSWAHSKQLRSKATGAAK